MSELTLLRATDDLTPNFRELLEEVGEREYLLPARVCDLEREEEEHDVLSFVVSQRDVAEAVYVRHPAKVWRWTSDE